MYLVFDTETSGLFDFKQPADAPGQPRLGHVNMLRCDKDGNTIGALDFIIDGADWTEADFAAIEHPDNPNDVTRAKMQAHGVPIGHALSAYVEAIGNGDTVVAYNARYDTKVMRAELRRAGMPDLFESTPNICVMEPMTNICQIPHPKGWKSFKWPNLTECMEFLGVTLEDAHSAGADTEAARLVLQYLIQNGKLPEPSVKYAKQKPEPAAASSGAVANNPTHSGSIPDQF
jgi:DNA polymerase-3 subunit epsilon